MRNNEFADHIQIFMQYESRIFERAQALVEEHRQHINDWQAQKKRAYQLRIDKTTNKSRINAWVPIFVTAARSHGRIEIRFQKQHLISKVTRARSRPEHIPLQPGGMEYDMRKINRVLRKVPELIPIFKETEAEARKIRQLSQELREACRCFERMEKVFSCNREKPEAATNAAVQVDGESPTTSSGEYIPKPLHRLRPRTSL